MSNMMIYAALSATGGNIENVYGTKMRVQVVDEYDKDLVERLISEGWSISATDTIEKIETQKLEVENQVMKDELSNGDNDKRIDELEGQLSEALEEIAGFEQERTESNKVVDEKIARIAELEGKLEIYEEGKDTNGNGKVDYEELTIPQLSTLLKKRDVEHNVRDGKDALVKLANDSE